MLEEPTDRGETETPEGTPDLTILPDRARADFAVSEKEFTEDSCELHPDEMCVDAPGVRKLLYFSVETPNIGDADLVMGSPRANDDLFVYSECHNHFHFVGYAEYRLLDEQGLEVRTGRKQAFCLVDSQRISPDGAPNKRYTCEFQGIQKGWSDVYSSRVGCQHLDITELAHGPYILEIRVNTSNTLSEASYENNFVRIPVTLGAAALDTPTEMCDADLSDASTHTENRECGWRTAGTFACTPGEKVRLGCAQRCQIGRCTGDPMLRVCDAETPSQNCSYPNAVGFGNDQCGGRCPVTSTFRCPESGSLDVFAAPKKPGASFSCDVELIEIGP